MLDVPLPSTNAHSLELLLSIKCAIEAAGHLCVIGEKSVAQLTSIRHIDRFTRSSKVDAWIVYCGTRKLLERFAKLAIPVLAIGGRALGLPIASAGTDVSRAMAAAVDALVAHGHRRIVFVCDSVWRNPTPNLSTQAFLDRLRHHGFPVSDYNLPEWEQTPEGLARLMNSLFAVTPPTALVIVEPSACIGARIFLAEHGIVVPRDLSLVNILPDPAFSLLDPVVAHFEWTIPALVNRAAQWVSALVQGNADHEFRTFHATFCPGGTIARANS
jgi:DNA-binding LacI/PurR family transcriptional regulator